jgi:hypothetical protein
MTMVRARLAISLAAVLLVGGLAGSARSSTTAPTNLHGFLLRADEPASTSFPRTPAFAWSPVAGALRYEFQLSLSSVFRDNSVVWADDNVSAPVLAPNITLPWITGNPHSLYARVRAVTSTGASAWSSSYGFDLAPPAAPTPLPSYPGLLRWTPVDGATGYQVWLLDANKMEVVTTNVLDEREAYTFHETPQWTATIRWRIRVLRPDISTSGGRLNTIPAVQYGPWSPVYTGTNPTFATGPLQLVGTVSDVFSDGSDTSPAHELMPAFVFSGNTSLSGQQAELFRVEVFTDRQCLNRVFTGPVTGAPSYAPRPFGPLAMPTSSSTIPTARTSYLPDGTEPAGVALDGDKLLTTESQPDASPTGSPPPAPGETSGSSSPSSDPASSPSSSSSSFSSSSSSPAPSSPASAPISGTVSWSGRTGAPVDLWDVDWPNAGYYWTVVPVAATPQDAVTTAVVGAGAQKGDKVVPVANTQNFVAGDVVQIGGGPTADTVTLSDVSRAQLTLASPLANPHPVGETVTRTSGAVLYRDLDLAQDACAAGRVERFGKASEPSLTSSGEVFATGMSSDGRLTSARHTTAFYGQPLVSWTPALGANAYEVQWSKIKYPFTPEAFGSANGYVTTGTSLVLPVVPGTWYYRVRGFDYSLPTGAQQMSWSDPAKLVVVKPRFKIVGGSAPKAKKTATPKTPSGPAKGYTLVKGTGYSLELPTDWKRSGTTGFQYTDALGKANVFATISASERSGRTYAAWADALATQLQDSGSGPVSTAVVQLAAGKGIRLTTTVTKNGTTKSVLEYVVDKGNIEYIVAFGALQQNYTKYLPTFGHAISTFKLG